MFRPIIPALQIYTLLHSKEKYIHPIQSQKSLTEPSTPAQHRLPTEAQQITWQHLEVPHSSTVQSLQQAWSKHFLASTRLLKVRRHLCSLHPCS